MALHWQPRDADPMSEFSPEPVAPSALAAAPAARATCTSDIAVQATLLDALLLAVAGMVFGAILFAVYWTLR